MQEIGKRCNLKIANKKSNSNVVLVPSTMIDQIVWNAKGSRCLDLIWPTVPPKTNARRKPRVGGMGATTKYHTLHASQHWGMRTPK